MCAQQLSNKLIRVTKLLGHAQCFTPTWNAIGLGERRFAPILASSSLILAKLLDWVPGKSGLELLLDRLDSYDTPITHSPSSSLPVPPVVPRRDPQRPDAVVTEDERNQHDLLLAQFGGCENVLYAAKVLVKHEGRDTVVFKVGRTGTTRPFQFRVKEHAREFATFTLFAVVVCDDSALAEQRLKKKVFYRTHRIKARSMTRTQSELLLPGPMVTTVGVAQCIWEQGVGR